MTQPVVDDPAREQFAVSMGGGTARMQYALEGDRLFLVHTEVPDASRGQGAGGRLVEAALAKARAAKLTIVPWCPYARRWLKDHPEQTGEVAVDYKAPPPRQ